MPGALRPSAHGHHKRSQLVSLWAVYSLLLVQLNNTQFIQCILMPYPTPFVCLSLFCLISVHQNAFGFPQTDQETSGPTSAIQDSQAAAEVNSFAISIGSAKKLLDKSLPNLPNQDRQEALLNAAVNRMVDRHVVYDYLSKQELAAGENEIRLQLENFKSELAKVNQTIEQFLDNSGQRLEELEFDMAWRIAWNRYLKREVTDEKIEEYFQQHRRKFDDSDLRVAHLLIKPEPNGPLKDSLEKAERIFAELQSGQLGWEDAVKQYSAAPTRDAKGEIGWITYHKPMPPTFSQAAFKLQADEISGPVVTPFGVHLIKCLELKEGKTGWRDALNEVRQNAIRDLFRELARRHRANVSIKFNNGFSEITETPTENHR